MTMRVTMTTTTTTMITRRTTMMTAMMRVNSVVGVAAEKRVRGVSASDC